jgi:hypothetical protein
MEPTTPVSNNEEQYPPLPPGTYKIVMEQPKEAPSFMEIFIKLLPSIITLAAVVAGIWQFNAGQKENKTRELNMRQMEIEKMNNQSNREILAKFKENQNRIYSEAMSVVGYIATHKDWKSEKYQEAVTKFDQLYWVDLSSVATENVNKALLKFQNILKNLQMNSYNNINEKIYDLQEAGENVAIAIRESSMDYTLPGGLKGLEDSTKTKH